MACFASDSSGVGWGSLTEGVFLPESDFFSL